MNIEIYFIKGEKLRRLALSVACHDSKIYLAFV